MMVINLFCVKISRNTFCILNFHGRPMECIAISSPASHFRPIISSLTIYLPKRIFVIELLRICYGIQRRDAIPLNIEL